jgi:threonine synthase
MTEPIRYVSTRGTALPVGFAEALLRGLAPDGGLYVPARIPQLPAAWSRAQSLAEVGALGLDAWLGAEVGQSETEALARDALGFPVPLVRLEAEAGSAWEGVYVLELFHGPTLSFKDVGARTMARLAALFQRRGGAQSGGAGETTTILVATSGDTGSAVADGFAGVPGIEVALLYPEGQVSAVQESQLVAAREGVRTFAVGGTFDDCQRVVKAAFADPALRAVRLSSANSINVGRLVPQSFYYAWAQAQASHAGWFGEATFVVPSGNLGNLTAGMLAAEGGVPTRGFVAAHNANDFFPNYLREEATREAMGPSVRTDSNAMDVGAPSNFERLEYLFGPQELRRRVWGTSVDDARTSEVLREVYEATGYLACPHTAVGLEGARRYREATDEDGAVVVLATAHPAKFPAVVKRAVGTEPTTPPRLAAFAQAERRVTPLAPTAEALRDALLHSREA